MDMLQKKTVKELRSVLREYKKIHCKPYSRLKKAQMIELIKYHGIFEHDIEKTGKIKTQSKPKSKIKSVRDEHDEIIKKLAQSRTHSQRIVANADNMKRKAQKEMLTIAEKSKKRQQNPSGYETKYIHAHQLKASLESVQCTMHVHASCVCIRC